MKVAQITAPDHARITTVAPPTIAEHDILIKVAAAGICGTDLHIYHGEYEATYPIIPGHEFCGTVEAVGTQVTNFQVGDRVTADPNIPCNRCPACQRGEANQCHHLEAVGVTRNGAFAEYVAVPEGSVFPIGDMPFAEAALIEPLACVVWGLKRVQVQPGDSALIYGAGPMGCMVLQAVRQTGAASVVVTDTSPERLALAEQLGATAILADNQQHAQLQAISPAGFNITVDATGIPAVLEQCFDHVRPRGKVWVFGVCPPEATASFTPYEVFRKDLSIIGSFAVNRTFAESIALIQSGAIQVAPLISHQLPLDDFVEGLQFAEHDPGRMKVQFIL